MKTTDKVLREIGAGDVPSILAVNKADLLEPAMRDALASRFPGGLVVSVKTGEGIPVLLAAIEEGLTANAGLFKVRIPDTDYGLVALLRREAQVLGEERDDEGTTLSCRVPDRLVSRFEKYKVE